MTLKYLSVCSGIEAATVAWKHLGWKPVGFSEIESFPCRLLAHHYPEVKNFGDMTKFQEWKELKNEKFDILCGGTPCTSFSVCGLKQGLSDQRGSLVFTFCQIANHFDPEWVFFENVPGLLSSKDNAFGCLLAGLCGSNEPINSNGRWDNAGLVVGPQRTVAWRICDSKHFGIPQSRKRLFVVACKGARWKSPAALFSISEGMLFNFGKNIEKECESSGNSDGRIETSRCIKYGRVVKTTGHQGDGVVGIDDKYWPTLSACGGNNGGGAGAILHSYEGLRRLTPVECERIQGFPDNYTLIPGAKDRQRYKSIGNSWPIPIIKWIGERINLIERNERGIQ